MKILISTIAAMLLLAGCASLEEAYYVDREFGQAQQISWDLQVADTGYRHAAKTPEITEGITAEEIMGIYNQTFAEEPEQVEIFQFGIGD
jgi:hypothetical protein